MKNKKEAVKKIFNRKDHQGDAKEGKVEYQQI